MTFNPLLFCRAEINSKLEASAAARLSIKDGCSLLVTDHEAVVSAVETSAALPAGGFALSSSSLLLLPKDKCTYTLISLQGAAAENFAASLPRLWAGSGSQYPTVANALHRLLRQNQDSSAIQQSAHAYSLVCALHEAVAHGTPTPLLPPLVSCAIDAMQQNYAEVYGIEELSEELGVSKSHLVRVFSAAMGTSPGRYLTGVRVDAAKRLLLQRQYSLQIIASLCGFSSTHYFCKVFKKSTALSPTDWRNENLQNSNSLPARPASQQEDIFYL